MVSVFSAHIVGSIGSTVPHPKIGGCPAKGCPQHVRLNGQTSTPVDVVVVVVVEVEVVVLVVEVVVLVVVVDDVVVVVGS